MPSDGNTNDTAGTGALIGRDHDSETLDAFVRQASERGGALIVQGDAGAGKSSLLAAAGRRAQSDGMQVWRLAGVRAEKEMPFAGLHQLLKPLLERAHDLSLPHRETLLATFGRSWPSTPDDFTIAVATIRLLSEIAKKAPLIVTIDDAHWLDIETAQVLGLVARRLGPEPVGLLLGLRQGYDTALLRYRIPEIRLGPLDEASAASLLDATAPRLPRGLRARMLAEAAGNPLALMELPLADPPDQALFGRPERLPTTTRLRQAFADQLFHVPAATRALLLVASVDERASLDEIVKAAARMGYDFCASADDLEPAVASRLIEHDHVRVSFRHPLIPAAIYDLESAALRRRAHAALAAVLDSDPTRRVWHRAASLVSPDETTANDLVLTANKREARKSPGMKVAALERAAELTPATGLRQERLLAAAELAVDIGQPDRARRLLSDLDPEACGRLHRARIWWMHETIEGGLVKDCRAINQIVDEAIQADVAGETDLALRLLLAAALRSWWADPGSEVRRRIVVATHRVRASEADARILSILAMTDPEGSSEELAEAGSQALPWDSSTENRVALGSALHVAGAFDRSLVILAGALRGARRQGGSWALPRALAQQTWNAIYVGDFSAANANGEEAIEIAERLGQPLWQAAAQTALSLMAAIRGDEESAEARLAEAEGLALPMGATAVLADVQLARAMLALGAGRHDEAFEHLRRTFDPFDPSHHYIRSAWRIGELAEAAVQAGRVEEAREQLARLETRPHFDLSPRLKIGLVYARPLLADHSCAEALFQAALQENLRDWPFYRARLLLQYGMWLRRQRKTADARMPLRTARDSFLALGAAPWAERARQELRASRESQHNGSGAWTQLTEQELQIAEMAAQGLSNREIGQRLYISPRTVGSHLYRIFPKLGIATRAQLPAVLDDRRRSRTAS